MILSIHLSITFLLIQMVKLLSCNFFIKICYRLWDDLNKMNQKFRWTDLQNLVYANPPKNDNHNKNSGSNIISTI